MSTVTNPEGLESLAVWDANNPDWPRGPFRERAEWVKSHVGDPIFIFRAEFYLIDTAFAVMRRFVPDGDGRKWAADGELVTESVIVPLAELPPAHLLKG